MLNTVILMYSLWISVESRDGYWGDFESESEQRTFLDNFWVQNLGDTT